MSCNEQIKIVSKYFAVNLLNLTKQQIKKEMMRKQKDMKSKLSKFRKE